MSTLERWSVIAAAFIGALCVSAWVSAPPRPVDGPVVLSTSAAELCAELRGNAAPETVRVLADAADVSLDMRRLAADYADEPTPAGLQRLRLMCP